MLDPDDDTFTGLKSDNDAFSVLAKIPDGLTVSEALRLVNLVSRHINDTCRIRPDGPTTPHATWAKCVTEEDRQSGVFLLPSLTDPPSSDHVREVALADVYKPYPHDLIVVDAPRLTIRSAVSHMPLRFDSIPVRPFRHRRDTCTRIEVGERYFTLFNTLFDQTGCAHLPPRHQIPIIFSGKDVSNARVHASVNYDGSMKAATAVAVRGQDNHLFAADRYIDTHDMHLEVGMYKYNKDTGDLVAWNDTTDVYFSLATSKVNGTMTVTAFDHLPTIMVHERQARKQDYVIHEYDCGPRPKCKNKLGSIYTCVGNCRVLNMTNASGVSGAAYEKKEYKTLRDHTPLYILSAVVLTFYGAALVAINMALVLVGDRIIHRLIGLDPPMSTEEVIKLFEPHDCKLKKHKRHRHKKFDSDDPPEKNCWIVQHPKLSVGRPWQSGYGVSVVMPSGQTYYVEKLALSMREGKPLPHEIITDAPDLIEALKNFNLKL